MTSINGTDTAYGSLAGNYLALTLDCSDTIFGTDINMCSLVHKMKIVDGQENDPEVLKRYKELESSFNYALAKQIPQTRKTVNTILDCLERMPECSEIVKMIHSVGYDTDLTTSYPTTFIAPINSAISPEKQMFLRTKHRGILKALLKAHTLNYILSPVSLEGRILRVTTKCKPFSFISDGSGQITKECTFYQPSTQLLSSYEYNRVNKRIHIKKIVVTDNGILYIIDDVFTPENIMYANY